MNKKSALINVFLLACPVFIAIPVLYGVFVFLYRPNLFLTMMCAAILVGFVLFFTAKLSIFKAGNFLSFGYSEMSPMMRRLYLTGYSFMLVGACGIVVWTFMLS